MSIKHALQKYLAMMELLAPVGCLTNQVAKKEKATYRTGIFLSKWNVP